MFYSITFWFLLCVFLICWAKKPRQKKHSSRKSVSYKPAETQTVKQESEYQDYTHAYQKRWLFSYNEKAFYQNLKQFADDNNLVLLAKVRLLDLIEPRKGQDGYKAYFYKIQAKHVDFVLCAPNLVAKYIIELDDASHETSDRRERDSFVDTALTSCGYKILHTRAFDLTALSNLIQSDQ